MKDRSFRVVALLLMCLFALPTSQLIALAQEADTNTAQHQPKPQSKEEEKLGKAEENRAKKEEERKRREEKARASKMKKYSNLTDFALDLYASNSGFRDYVDDQYLDLQRQHTQEAYRLNISRSKEVLVTESGEALS